MRILITGISGRLGRRVAQRLRRHHEIIGVDRRPCPALPTDVVHHRVDLRRRPAEDVFRNSNVDAVIHMGVVHNFRIPAEKLYARNIISTETLLNYVSKYGVKKLVLLSSGDVYGPSPQNSHFLNEEAPLLASQRFPEIRALVAVDRMVQSFFWKYPDIETVILRPSFIVGPNVRNAPSKYFGLTVVPTLMGFDPMVQLIHEDDLLRMMEASLQPQLRGVFNLTSTPPVPLSRIVKILGKPTVPVPAFVAKALLERAWRYRLTSFPAPELDHIRYSTVLDTSRARRELNAEPERSLYEILEPFRVDGRTDEAG